MLVPVNKRFHYDLVFAKISILLVFIFNYIIHLATNATIHRQILMGVFINLVQDLCPMPLECTFQLENLVLFTGAVKDGDSNSVWPNPKVCGATLYGESKIIRNFWDLHWIDVLSLL